MVDKTLLMGLAALHQGIEGRVIAELWLGQFALGDLEVEVCEVTTIQMPNQVASAEDDRRAVLLHLPPETAVLPGPWGTASATSIPAFRRARKACGGGTRKARIDRVQAPPRRRQRRASEGVGRDSRAFANQLLWNVDVCSSLISGHLTIHLPFGRNTRAGKGNR
jgi:hypothetical protein